MKKLLCIFLAVIMSFGVSVAAFAAGLNYSHTTKTYFTTTATAGHPNVFLYYDCLYDNCTTLSYAGYSLSYRYSRAYKCNSDGSYTSIGPYCPVTVSSSPTTIIITDTGLIDRVKMRVYNGYYHDSGISSISMYTDGSYTVSTHGSID